MRARVARWLGADRQRWFGAGVIVMVVLDVTMHVITGCGPR